MKGKLISLISIIFILLAGMMMTGCMPSMSKTPLGGAAERGDINAVKDLMAKGSNACEEQEYGQTAYMLAATYDLTIFPLDIKYRTCRDEIYRTLMDNAYETFNKSGQCPGLLHYAAMGGCSDIVKKLLEKGSNPDDKYSGVTALTWAALYGGQLETIKILLNKGADFDSAITELKEIASKQLSVGLNEPLTRKTYDKANQGVEMLNRLKPKQVEPTTIIATGTASAPVLEKPTIKSDVDELPTIKAKPNKNAYAIVIGIEQYRQKLPKADYAVADAKTMTEYLTKVMGYPEENVVTLLNEHATNVDFAKYFEKWLPNNVEKDGSVFIYYSGHGAPNTKTGDAYLVPYDGDPSFIEQTGYPLKKLYESLNKLQAKEIIVALDSCFSGAGGKSVIAKGARPLVMNLEHDIKLSKNMVVMSASSGDQISSTYEEKGHGLFTYFLLKGIKDGITEIGELFDYLKPHVGRTARKVYNNEQTPQLIAPKELIRQRLIER